MMFQFHSAKKVYFDCFSANLLLLIVRNEDLTQFRTLYTKNKIKYLERFQLNKYIKKIQNKTEFNIDFYTQVNTY